MLTVFKSLLFPSISQPRAKTALGADGRLPGHQGEKSFISITYRYRKILIAKTGCLSTKSRCWNDFSFQFP